MAKDLVYLLKKAAKKLEEFDFGAATKLYSEALEVQPGNIAASMGLAMVYNRTEKPLDALKILGKIWEAVSAPKNKATPAAMATVLAQVGLAQQQLGKWADALQSYRKAHALTPSDEVAGKIKQLQSLVEMPEPIQQLIQQAMQQHRAGKLDMAVKLYQAALQLNQDHPDALHGLGMVMREKKESNSAMALVQQAIVLEPERADFYNDLGMIFQDRGELEKAINFHKRALRLQVTFAPAYINLGVAYKRLGQLDDAINAYQEALKLQPDMPETHNNLGNLLRLKGDTDGAREALSRALALRPNYLAARQNLEAVEQLLSGTQNNLGSEEPLATSVPKPATRKTKGSKKGSDTTCSVESKTAPVKPGKAK
ncbi:tetratricopeptide repeat protein [Azonexus sp.]|uniref:tetratricopeptide repeat protein n=1 Tax=Azonexus sp. TaxID=1872668 RepID=UPI0027B97755|nr:tetratricopeptide repeat protein [Azonexus sp.]